MRQHDSGSLLQGNLRPVFLRYLFPSIAATVMISINFFIDTLCIGQKMGEAGLASLNFAMPTTFILYALGSLLGAGGATVFSAYIGKGEKKEARQIYTVSITTLLAAAVLFMVLGLLFLPQITTFLGSTGESRQGTMEYLKYVFLFAPFFSLEMFLSIFVRNDDAPKLSMLATFCGSGLNIILDFIFIFIFEWGMTGASLATSLALVVSTSVLILSTMRKKSVLRFARVQGYFRKLLHVTRVGLPSLVTEMTTSIVTLTFNTVLMKLSGETAVSVYGVIANLTTVVVSSLTGVSNAMQPLTSINAGARRWTRVRQALRMALISALALGAVCVVIGELWPDLLVRIFVQADESFMEMARVGIRIVFLSYLLVGPNILLSTYFQSIQSNNEAVAISVLRGVVFPVVCVVGCAFFFGETGVWISTVVAEVLTLLAALILLIFVRRRIRELNYQPLGYFDSTRPAETLDNLLEGLGAEDLTIFQELMERCDARNSSSEAIPHFLCLDDLTAPDRSKQFEPAQEDKGLGLVLAVGAMLFTNLYEQQDEDAGKDLDSVDYPPAVRGSMALAEKCFRFTLEDPDSDGDNEDFSIVPFDEVRLTYPNTDIQETI